MGAVFAVTRSRSAAWRGALPMEEQDGWAAHAAFMNDLHASGFVLLAGPLEGTRDVLLIVKADDPEDVRSRLACDPWTRNDLLRTTRVLPWTLRLGSLL